MSNLEEKVTRRKFLKLLGATTTSLLIPNLVQASETETWHIYLNNFEIRSFEKNKDEKGFTREIKSYLPSNISINSVDYISNGYKFDTDNGDIIRIVNVPIEGMEILESHRIPENTISPNRSLERLLENIPYQNLDEAFILKKYGQRKPKSNLKISSFSRNELLDINRNYSNNQYGVMNMLIDFAKFYKIDEEKIPTYLAHIFQESTFNPDAQNAGWTKITRNGKKIWVYSDARGLGQFIKSTAKEYNLDWKDVYIGSMNADASVRYFKNLLNSNNNNIINAIAGYVGKTANPKQFKKHMRRVESNLVTTKKLVKLADLQRKQYFNS